MAGKEAGGFVNRRCSTNALPKTSYLVAMLHLMAIFCLASTTHAQVAAPRDAAAPGAGARNAGQPAALRVLAVVNGEQVTRQALADECLRRYGEEVLENLISKHIILQACNARGVTVTDQDVNAEIDDVATKFGLTVDRWLSLLETERDVDASQYRRDIIWPTLALRRLAAKQVEVTDDEFKQAFESEYGPKVKARLISVSSRQKADQLVATARANPSDFPRLAKEHSEDQATASAYGVIPPIRMHMGDPELERIAFGLQEGQVSPPIQVGNQYLILKCEEQIERTYISSQQLPAIERQLRSRISDHKLRLQSADMFQDLQAKTQVVNIYKDPQLRREQPGVAAVINGQQITIQQLSEQCIERHGTEVLDGEINRTLLLQQLRLKKMEVGQQDIDREVARAADAYGFLKTDGSPDVDAWLKKITEDDATTVDLYIRDAVWPSVALKKLVGESVEVTSDDMQKGFDSNFGERVEVLAIVLTNHRQAQTVWEMARDNPTDQFFGDLANQYSIEPSSRANFGKVPPLRKHGGQPAVEKEAFRLKAGELSGIVAIGDKYVIMRCLGRTQPVVKDFEVVKQELYKDLQEKKLRIAMAQEFDRLKESAQIDNFLAGTSQSGTRLGPRTATPASFQQSPAEPAATIRR